MTEKRLRPKYFVTRFEGEPADATVVGKRMLASDPEDVDSPFVLLPRKDPAAYFALLNYAQACETDLGAEIRLWLDRIVEAPPVFGTQGDRNRIAMKKKQMDLFT